MTYLIKNFDETTGQLTVKFNSGDNQFAVDVPLTPEGIYITGSELDEYIRAFEPKDFNERLQKISQGIPNASEIAALVTASANDTTPQVTEEQLAAIEAARVAEIEKYVKAALIKLGVISA